MIKLSSATLLALALCACEQRQESAPPAEMTVGEERALEDAASMLDESRVPANPVGEAPAEDLAPPTPQEPAP